MKRGLNANYPGAQTAIGIAADEAEARPFDLPGKTYPLVEEGITQADTLQICYDARNRFRGTLSGVGPPVVFLLSVARNQKPAPASQLPP